MTQKTIPAISIVMSMYNFEDYIGECLDSILAQTFDDYEVIVVDDCSTDNSAAIVESYVPKFTRGGEKGSSSCGVKLIPATLEKILIWR